jgi:serine acetyltransferase
MQVKESLLKLKRKMLGNPLFRFILAPIKLFYYWIRLFLISFYNIILSLYCYKTVKIYLSNHLTIGILNLYKKRTKFPHPVGVVIGFKVNMGYDCIIYQNVTIGTKDTTNYLFANYPVIGDNVTIYPNAVIIGNISIGDNSIIGAGSIVNSDIPPNSIAYGNPAKIK